MAILDDPKMGNLPDHLFKMAILFFLLAGESDNNGYVIPESSIAWRLRMNQETVNADIEALIHHNILRRIKGNLKVLNFDKWQKSVPVNERVRKYRETRMKQAGYGLLPDKRIKEIPEISEEEKARLRKVFGIKR